MGMAISLCNGSVPLTLSQVWMALGHQGEIQNQTIVWDLRLPRILAAALVGAALGMSGGLLQGMLRNSLADPFVLGISAGAGLVMIVRLGGLTSGSAIGGALVLTLADLLARMGSVEFPVGVVTALFGSPVFIWLLYQRQSSRI